MKKKIIISFFSLLAIFVILGLFIYFSRNNNQDRQIINNVKLEGNNNSTLTNQLSAEKNIENFVPPINSALERITKKPFGIYISLQNSPVQPERFVGYHAGVDFETFADEQNIDVPIFAICSGSLIFKGFISGYGGAAVQVCKFQDQNITVIYGHLKLTSIALAKDQLISAGEQIGILGKGFSSETDGERKHLHLGIHLGKNIDFHGYVQNQKELNNWLDIQKYL